MQCTCKGLGVTIGQHTSQCLDDRVALICCIQNERNAVCHSVPGHAFGINIPLRTRNSSSRSSVLIISYSIIHLYYTLLLPAGPQNHVWCWVTGSTPNPT